MQQIQRGVCGNDLDCFQWIITTISHLSKSLLPTTLRWCNMLRFKAINSTKKWWETEFQHCWPYWVTIILKFTNQISKLSIKNNLKITFPIKVSLKFNTKPWPMFNKSSILTSLVVFKSKLKKWNFWSNTFHCQIILYIRLLLSIRVY